VVIARADPGLRRNVMDSTEFFLDETGEFRLHTLLDISPRWIEMAVRSELSRALVLVAGEKAETPALVAGEETRVWLKLGRGLPEISDDGLDAELWLVTAAGERRLMSWHLDNSDAGKLELDMALPVDPGLGFQLELRCGPGPRGNPLADWLAVLEWVVAPPDRIALLKSRCHAAWRMANEVAHFNAAYESSFYEHRRVDRGGGERVGDVRQLPPDAGRVQPVDGEALARRLGDPPPLPTDNAFTYCHRLLGQVLQARPPDFAQRMRDMAGRRPGPLRMLSLCAGEAAVEGMLLERAGVEVELCLVDVNELLLERAARRMPANVQVDRVLGSVNEIGPGLGLFDVINITSGLHHLVELEQVLRAIASMLSEGGEFWLIGEQVGRNGNRLWPEARAAAHDVFSTWPADKRRNSGSGAVDERVPDTDFSSACFEGIRSQDIPGMVERHFLPLQVHLVDAFLWRLVDGAYAGNFDLAQAGDRRFLQQAVVAEARHWLEGGRGTSLNGAWRAKRDLLNAAP
jgi:SAM-dependent methyltransferase